MKKITLSLIVMLFSMSVFAGTADELKINFCKAGTTMTSDYEAYLCYDKHPETFTATSYSAFGNAVSLAISYTGTPVSSNEVRFVDRNANTLSDVNMLKGWLSADGRTSTDQNVVMTLSGLPAGSYTWTSYHHDNDGLSSTSNLIFSTDGGTTTTLVTGVAASTGTNGPATVEHVFAADGTNDVIITLVTPNTNFSFINGFTLVKGGTVSTAPVFSAPVEDFIIRGINKDQTIDLTAIFTSPIESALTYQISSVNTAAVTAVSEASGIATITALIAGQDTIAIKAIDATDQEVCDTFIVEVQEQIIAAGDLKIDFSTDVTNTEDFNIYPIADKQAMDLFVPLFYGAFDAEVTVDLGWGDGMSSNEVRIWAGETGGSPAIFPNMKGDYICTDGRSTDAAMEITVSGLPTGTYTWTSYHVSEQMTGKMKISFTDANGEVTPDSVQIANFAKNVADKDTEGILTQTVESDGTPIVISIATPANSTPTYDAFTVINGFTLVKKDTPTSTKELATAADAIQVYPNPCINEVSIKYNVATAGSAMISIYQLNGQSVYTKRVNSIAGANTSTLDLDLTSGMYILDVTTGAKSQTQKLIVQ